MNKILRPLHRFVIRLCRFRHRCGYGVHSPFAFRLITDVIYQSLPYYAYEPLQQEEKSRAHQLARQASDLKQARQWSYESLRDKRLLFRLVNEVQPACIVDAGHLSASALYLKAAKTEAEYIGASTLDELYLEADTPIDFLYLHRSADPSFVEKVLEICLPRAGSRSLFVIEGIRYNPAMKRLWQQLTADPRTGISFDLYHLGLVFFDHSKQKQHYTVSY